MKINEKIRKQPPLKLKSARYTKTYKLPSGSRPGPSRGPRMGRPEARGPWLGPRRLPLGIMYYVVCLKSVKIYENLRKSTKNQQKSTNINENQLKYTEINQNLYKFNKIDESHHKNIGKKGRRQRRSL